MTLTSDQITQILEIGIGVVTTIYLLADLVKWSVKLLVQKAFGRKDPLAEMEQMLSKATNNHLHTIQDAVVKSVQQHEFMLEQGRQQFAQHERELELLSKIDGKLSK